MSFLDRIAECNAHEPAAYRTLTCAGHAIGAVRHRLAERLRDFPAVFAVSTEEVRLSDFFKDADQRSNAVERVVRVLDHRDPLAGQPQAHDQLLDQGGLARTRVAAEADDLHVSGIVADVLLDGLLIDGHDLEAPGELLDAAQRRRDLARRAHVLAPRLPPRSP